MTHPLDDQHHATAGAPAPGADAPQTRRRLLAGALGGVAALAAGALGRPAPADAANGDTVKVGASHSGASTTSFTATSTNHAIRGVGLGSGKAGVYGRNSSAGGRGVSGYSSATSGTSAGVSGQADSPTGRGVFGYASAPSGGNNGVVGQSNSVAGTGVVGVNSQLTGNTYGVRGVTKSPNGIGVYGNGFRAAMGETTSPEGIGVVARHSATTGGGTGLRALTLSPAGTAVYAENSGVNGTGYGVHARSSTGTTVLVENVSGLENGFGIQAVQDDGTAIEGSSSGGTGVRGEGLVGVLGVGPTGVKGDTGAGAGDGFKAVHGTATGTGVAGWFEHADTDRTALHVDGGLRILRAAGTTTFTNGQTTKTVAVDVPVNDSTIVLAQLRFGGSATLFVRRAYPSASSIGIDLSEAASNNTEVAYLVITTA